MLPTLPLTFSYIMPNEHGANLYRVLRNILTDTDAAVSPSAICRVSLFRRYFVASMSCLLTYLLHGAGSQPILS